MGFSLVVACVCIFIGTLLSYFTAINHSLFLLLNALLPISTLWLVITTVGDGAVAGCIFYVALRKHNDVLAKGLIAAMAGLLVSNGLKKLIGIPRPEHTAGFEGNFYQLAEDIAATSFAMPSGHTIAAFLLGTLLFKYLQLNRAGKILLGTLLVAVGASRIALGVHWPADVFAGAGLGIIIGLACIALPLHLANKSAVLIVHLLYLMFVVVIVHKYLL